MKEIWKTIEVNERYEVSNMGRVRISMSYEDNDTNDKRRRPRGTQIKLFDRGHGYMNVTLYRLDTKKYKIHKVHRLVAAAFLSNDDMKDQVNHKNGIKVDNRVSNLEWSTAQENMDHAWNRGLIYNNITKLGKKVVIWKDDIELEFETAAQAERYLGFNKCSISRVAAGGRGSIHGWKARYI